MNWGFVWALVDKGFDIAIRIDRWRDERRARKKRGLSWKDVQHQQEQIARATRARADTVVLPRPGAVTSRSPADAEPPPTAPRTPAPRR